MSNQVLKVLNRRGITLIYTAGGDKTYDPSTSSLTSGESYTYKVKGYFYSFTDASGPNGDVQKESRKLLISARDLNCNLVPKPCSGDTFEGKRDKVSVLSVKEVLNKDEIKAYILWVK